MHCWNVAQKDSALRYSLNTRMTHEAAYNRYRHELENIGIDSAAAFRRIIHSTQSLECHERRKRLNEQRDGTNSRKCGTMQTVKITKLMMPVADTKLDLLKVLGGNALCTRTSKCR